MPDASCVKETGAATRAGRARRLAALCGPAPELIGLHYADLAAL